MYFKVLPCLAVKDLAAARRFYQAIGMEVVDELPGFRVTLRSGSFYLALMTFLKQDSLNFRGADVSAMHAEMTAKIPGLPGKPERSRHRSGEGWVTRDPDGHHVFFDTSDEEVGESFKRQRIAEILEDAERELIAIGASAECVRALRADVIEKHARR